MIGKILLVAMTGTLMAQSQSDNGFRILYQTPSAPSSSYAVDSLYVSLKKIGMDCSLESLEENIPANPRGATLEAVVECAKKSGVSPTVIRSDMRSLLEVRMPAILHVNGDHFVTVLAVKDDDLFIFDNSIGLVDCSLESFAKRYQWEGVAVLFGRSPLWVGLGAYRRYLLAGVGSAGLLFIAFLQARRLVCRFLTGAS